MRNCLFCKIAAGEIPSHTIYENDVARAFLGIYPPVEGFTLVVPKKHSDEVWQMTADEYKKFMEVVRKVALHLRSKFDTTRLGVQIEGMEMAHTHVKLLPINTGLEFRAFEPKEAAKPEDLEKLAERLRLEN